MKRQNCLDAVCPFYENNVLGVRNDVFPSQRCQVSWSSETVAINVVQISAFWGLVSLHEYECWRCHPVLHSKGMYRALDECCLSASKLSLKANNKSSLGKRGLHPFLNQRRSKLLSMFC